MAEPDGDSTCRNCSADFSHAVPRFPTLCDECRPDRCPECQCVNFAWLSEEDLYRCDNGCRFTIKEAAHAE